MAITACGDEYTEEDKEALHEAEKGYDSAITQEVWGELFEQHMPEVKEELRRLDEQEAKSKEDLVEQSQKAEHIKIEVDPKDYPKAVQAMPVSGFDASGKITDSEIREIIRKDPEMQVLQRFFPEKTVPFEYHEGRLDVRVIIGQDGQPKTAPALGKTERDPKTGEVEKIVIGEHRLNDAIEFGFIKKEEIEKASQEEKDKAIKEAYLSTFAHERRGHLFTLEMLSEETKFKIVNLFYSVPERGARFVTKYAQKDSGEYWAEGLGIYEVRPEWVKSRDPELYNLIQEIEAECKSFVEISKNLVLVRGEKR